MIVMGQQSQKLILGTRASALALWQANHVKHLIESRFDTVVELKKISTKGDQIQDRSLMEIGGKALFLKEIEDELLAGTVDLAVHSMKDVPYQLPDGLQLSAILQREDATDAFLSVTHHRIEDLKPGATVGTSSVRRMVQLQKQFPDLSFQPLRGNVDTRLHKLQTGQFDAIVLASAGLVRLGLAQHIKQRLNIVAAVGQGAIGLEVCSARSDMIELCRYLHHEKTGFAVEWERYFSRHLQGSCQTPMGCHVREDANGVRIEYFYARPDGSGFQIGQRGCERREMQNTMDFILGGIHK